ncbi:hypothetical protein GQX74_001618 [Glossina fuscipes]|nr:hypothetical protein GQX74_001618 [Glossina fuscipes]
MKNTICGLKEEIVNNFLPCCFVIGRVCKNKTAWTDIGKVGARILRSHQGSQTIMKLSRPQVTTFRNNLLYNTTDTGDACVLPSVKSTRTRGLHLIATNLRPPTKNVEVRTGSKPIVQKRICPSRLAVIHTPAVSGYMADFATSHIISCSEPRGVISRKEVRDGHVTTEF